MTYKKYIYFFTFECLIGLISAMIQINVYTHPTTYIHLRVWITLGYDMTLELRPNSSVLVSSDQRILTHNESIVYFHVSFTEDRLLSHHSALKLWLVECCSDAPPMEVSPISTQDLCTSAMRLSGPWSHLSLRSFYHDCSVSRSALVMVVPLFFDLRIMEVTDGFLKI